MKETDDNVKVYKDVIITVEFAMVVYPKGEGWPRGINQRLSLAKVSNLVRDLDEAVLSGFTYDIVATRVQDITLNRMTKEDV